MLSSENTNNAVGSYALKDFTNVFSDNFNTCFTYVNESGDIQCKKDGWYLFEFSLEVHSTATDNYSYGSCAVTVNNVYFRGVNYSYTSKIAESISDNNSLTLFIKSGDVIKFSKSISANVPSSGCKNWIRILKI